MKVSLTTLLLCLFIIVDTGFTQAENGSKIEGQINKFQNLMSDDLRSYLQPFADAFGANLNSGLYHTAKIPKSGLHFYVGIETMLALIGNDQREYTAVLIDENGMPVEEPGLPTVFGSEEDRQIDLAPGVSYILPGGFDIRVFPIVAPLVTLGSVAGTEFSLRWVDVDLGTDFGLLKISGFGLRHSLSQYFPLSPLDICFGFFVQDFKLGRIFKANMGYFGAQASRSLGPLTVYGGVGIEKSTFTLGNDENVLKVAPITFDSANRTRLNAGVTLSILILKLHVDYTLGMQNILVAGIGIGI
jgi:hypothetical protein